MHIKRYYIIFRDYLVVINIDVCLFAYLFSEYCKMLIWYILNEIYILYSNKEEFVYCVVNFYNNI